MKIRIFLAVISLVFLINGAAAQRGNWIAVKSEARFNFSGMALVAQTEKSKIFLVVHDNKDQFADARVNPLKNKTERIGLLTIEAGAMRPRYENLQWEGGAAENDSLPVDLESVTSVPNEANRFLAGVGNPSDPEEKGRIYYLELARDRKSVRVLSILKLPTAGEAFDYEGFAVQQFGGKLYAFWADRGRNEKAATLFWGEINLKKKSVNLVGKTEIKTPAPDLTDFTDHPTATTRSISDLKIDSSGGVFAASTLDGADEGPFASAFYFIGAFSDQGNSIIFKRSKTPLKLYEFKNYKIEAFEFAAGKNGGVIFGTDDELFGASVFYNFFD